MNKQKVEKVFARVCKKYGLESGRFTKADFYRICEEENILLANTDEIKQRKLISRGFYAEFLKNNNLYQLIYLKCFFQKYFNRLVAYHELGHYFMKHIAGNFEANHRTDSIKEAEADYFAELATGLKRRTR